MFLSIVPSIKKAATRVALAAVLVLPLCSVPKVSHAGGNNFGASAYLTWSATDKNVTDTNPAAINNLYVYLERAAKLSFKGGEIDLTWNPAGDGGGCFDHVGTL